MKKFKKQFGGKIDSIEIEKLAKSKHWNGKKFENLEETTMDINWNTLPGLLKKQFTNTKNRRPNKDIPIIPFKKKEFSSLGNKFIWYGHGVFVLQLSGKNIIIDPMFGQNASPIAPIETKRFSSGSLEIIDDLPEIDAVFMSHDHYDHLDLDSYHKLMPKVKEYFVPIGVARHLKSWGISSSKITELDWWQNTQFENIEITFTPSRHSTGRGLSDRDKSLWGGYTFKTKDLNLYFTGDGGYGKHFKEIGQELGPFDFAFIECGQYNKEWHQIHMYPEESVQAALDVNAKSVLPYHWAGFKLSLHDWTEPVERFTKEAHKKELNYCTPKIGALVHFNQEKIHQEKWWDFYN